MEYIIFLIVGLSEVGPNICKIDYQRYVDIESITIPCDIIKKETQDAKSI